MPSSVLGEEDNVSFEGGKLNVCRENNLGNTSDGWFHDVYFTVLLFAICDDPLRKDHLLQKAI